MTFPIEDAGFTLWHADLDTRMKQLYGTTSGDLDFDRRWLAECYYAGATVDSVLNKIPDIAEKKPPAQAGTKTAGLTSTP